MNGGSSIPETSYAPVVVKGSALSKKEPLKVTRLSDGANGVVYMLSGKTFGSSVMKIPKMGRKDNSVREYLVGKELNAVAQYFPAIVRTDAVYGFKGNAEDVAAVLRTIKPIAKNIDDVNTMKGACENAGHSALFLHNAQGATLSSYRGHAAFADHELLGVLLQVYYTFFMIKNDFTHHDLHCSNILVHRPHPQKCTKYRFLFNSDGNTGTKEWVEIKCAYTAQVIDYGRMYNKKVADLVKRGIGVAACNTTQCGRKGENCGFKYLRSSHNYDEHNDSQDLRLLKEVLRKFGDGEKGTNKLPKELLELCKNVEFGDGDRYFTREQTRDKDPNLSPTLIYDISDAAAALGNLCLTTPHLQCQDEVYRVVTIDGVHPFSIDAVAS
jgi:hypothetical protein